MKKIIYTKQAPEPIGPYSQAVMLNNMLYTSGQIAIDPSDGQLKTGNIREETELVMKNIGALLKEAGLGFQHVIKSSIFVSDMNNFALINEVYGSFFRDAFPARETVEVARLPKDVNVEISVIASKD